MTRRVFGFAVLLALAFITHLMTSQIMRAQNVSTDHPLPRPSVTITRGEPVKPSSPEPDAADVSGIPGIPYPERHPPGTAIYGLRDVRVEAIGQFVHLSGVGEILNKRDPVSLTWVVQIRSPETRLDDQTVLFEQRYDDQRFLVNHNALLAPSFEDVVEVPLPAGEYMAGIGLEERGRFVSLRLKRITIQ